MTIVEMLERNVKRFPDKTAIISGNEKIPYKVFYKKVAALANYLVAMGVKKGDRVGLMMTKSPEVIISFLGAVAAGGIVYPLDYNQKPADIEFILNLTRPSAVIADEKFLDLLYGCGGAGMDEKTIVIGAKESNRRHLWENIFVDSVLSLPDVRLMGDDLVYLNFTSGTTGLPKGALTTNDNIYWNTLSSVETLELTEDDIHLCMFPVFSHPHELFARPLYLGGTLVLTDSIYPKSIAAIIAEHRVTCMMAVASIYDALVRLPESFTADLSSLRMPESGGMHLNPILAHKFKDRFGVSIFPVWGSTETSGIAVVTPVREGYRPGSMGKPARYYEVKVLGDQGEPLPADQVGEMAVKGPGVCPGYYHQNDETNIFMQDGWFRTGDMVRTDHDGYFYFASRKNGMMKVAGLKVFPTEIEDILAGHPNIKEVAVVKGVDEENLHGEVPKAVIVVKDGLQLSKSDIRKYCEERMSKYKVPRIIEFRNALPRTSGGKILYRELQ